MYYAVNPTFDPVTDAIVNDLAPIDHSKPSVVLLHSALGSVAAFSSQVGSPMFRSFVLMAHLTTRFPSSPTLALQERST